MARAPRKSPRNRLDPLKSRKTEHKVERQSAVKKNNMVKQKNQRPGNHTELPKSEPWRRWSS